MRSDKENLEDLSELAHFYLLNRRYTAAINTLRRALKQQSDSVELLLKLGLAYEGLNQLDEAIAAFRRVIELDPKNEEAERHLSRLAGNRGL